MSHISSVVTLEFDLALRHPPRLYLLQRPGMCDEDPPRVRGQTLEGGEQLGPLVGWSGVLRAGEKGEHRLGGRDQERHAEGDADRP